MLLPGFRLLACTQRERQMLWHMFHQQHVETLHVSVCERNLTQCVRGVCDSSVCVSTVEDG